MLYRDSLENLRAVIFTGKERALNTPFMTQEQYIEQYEWREDRDPIADFKAIEKAATPLLTHYKEKLEQIARMEALINPPIKDEDNGHEDEFGKNPVLESLYEEIATIDTEEQWLKFVEQF